MLTGESEIDFTRMAQGKTRTGSRWISKEIRHDSPVTEVVRHDTEFDHEPAIGYGEFGEAWLRRVFHLERLLRSLDRILGDELHIGPIGAGPGRRIATLTVDGEFLPSWGEEVPGAAIAYRVYVPVKANFDVNLRVDIHHFEADLVVPLTLALRPISPLQVIIDIVPPHESELQFTIADSARRSNLLRKFSGLDAELRRFGLKIFEYELAKPHVQRALHLNVEDLIDGAWDAIADQFLPNSPEDRER